MNPLLEVLCNEINKIKKILTTTGTDYTATVTRVDGNTAYVQMSGSEIADTPVSMTINANVGDKVRVRVSAGKAWITGNDTAPPADNKQVIEMIENNSQGLIETEAKYSRIDQTIDNITLQVGEKMDSDMSNRASSISIDSGRIEFNSNTLVVNSDKFKLDEDGNAMFGGVVSFIAKDTGNVKHDVQIGPENSGGTPIHIQTLFSDDTVKWLNVSDTEIRFYYEPANSNDYQYNAMDAFGAQMEGWTSTDATHGYLETMQMNKSSLYYSRPGQGSCTFNYTGAHPSSDIRLKEDITMIDPETAKHLMPVQFRFKGDDKTHYGFIAQDVQKILPDVVDESKDGYLTLTYHELIAPLYALVQEQEEQISRQEARIEQLEKGE